MKHRSEHPRTVDDLMTVEPIVVSPSDTLGRARDLVLTLGIHALPVMLRDEVVGLVTSHDLVDDWPDDELVSTVMSEAPLTIDVDAGVSEAADLMVERRIHHLLVERAGQPVGILSSLDLLHALRLRADS